MSEYRKKIILAGGGTLGSVSPLIAVWQKIKEANHEAEFLFVGTKNGPEKEFVGRYQIPYQSIIAGKFRRYFSVLNIFDFVKIILAIFQSFNLLRTFKPEVIVSAGGFVSVPLIWASYFFKIKVILYQPDLKEGLANKLCQKFAARIFTAFPETVKDFPADKAEYLGSLLRQEITQVIPSTNHVTTSPPLVRGRVDAAEGNKQPATILILGGGTGSAFINQLIVEALPELTKKYRVIHVTGHDKNIETRSSKPETNTNVQNLNYQNFELLTENYYQTMSEADLVISRAGLSTLMELSCLAKSAILIPLPNSAQEQNAEYFSAKGAAVCLNQNGLTPEKLINAVNNLTANQDLMDKLICNIKRIFEHNNYKKIINAVLQ